SSRPFSKADESLAYLTHEIARLRDRLKQLEEQHVLVSSCGARNRGILSSLRILPPEVLSEIFSLTLPSGNSSWYRGRFRMTDSPWSLTHVNRCWRAVAVSNPLLWSLVPISYHSHFDPKSSYPLAMVQTHIARADRLKIHFYGCQSSDSQPQIEIFECLARHASQWEELSLRLTSDLWPLLALLRGRFPLLQLRTNKHNKFNIR
ncbi:hypothetical protein B0H19DRAFT_1328836, partial [Mycena capillaripes]